MRILVLTCVIFALNSPSWAQSSEDAEREAAIDRIDAFARQLAESEYAPPGFSIAIVDRNGPLLVRGYGVANIETGQPVTQDTAFYNASVTKQYTALAAVRLDTQGVLNLDANLADLEPELELGRRLNAENITLRGLLTHSAHLGNSSLGFVTAYIGRLSPEEVFSQIEDHSGFVGDDFRYGNHGYVIYDSILQHHTGQDWRDAVENEVLLPAGMTQTTPRFANILDGEIAYGHEAGEEGWLVVQPKPDSLLHAAGGMFTTARDSAIWLEINLNEGRYQGEVRIPASDIQIAHTPIVDQDRSYGPLQRHQYAMGWNVGELDGETIFEHGGGYTGARAWNTFMPDQGLGVAILVNSGTGGNAFSLAVISQAYDELLDREDAATEAQRRLEEFGPLVEDSWVQTLEYRAEHLTAGSWQASQTELEAIAGSYRSERLGDLIVTLDEAGQLHGVLGAMQFEFTPDEAPGTLIANPGPGYEGFIAPWTVRFNRRGDVTGFDWQYRPFERVE